MVIFWLRGFIQVSRSDNGDSNSPWNRPHPRLYSSLSLTLSFRKPKSNFPDIPFLCFIPFPSVSLSLCLSLSSGPLSRTRSRNTSRRWKREKMGKIPIVRAVIMIGRIGVNPPWSLTLIAPHRPFPTERYFSITARKFLESLSIYFVTSCFNFTVTFNVNGQTADFYAFSGKFKTSRRQVIRENEMLKI